MLHAFLFHLLTSSWLTLRPNTTYLTEKDTLILYIWSTETSFSKILLAGFAQNEWVKRNRHSENPVLRSPNAYMMALHRHRGIQGAPKTREKKLAHKPIVRGNENL